MYRKKHNIGFGTVCGSRGPLGVSESILHGEGGTHGTKEQDEEGDFHPPLPFQILSSIAERGKCPNDKESCQHVRSTEKGMKASPERRHWH